MYAYSGIGSQKTPPMVLQKMYTIGKLYAAYGYILRSGHADGADMAFELGCDASNGLKEIFIPWKNFNKSDSTLYNVCDKAMQIAEYYHPAWGKCSQGAKKLHARNVYQVLGIDLKTPSKLIICWTPNGKLVGGTSTALKIAIDYGIKIENLGEKYGKY